jgi:DNA-binding NarL/FixJ family response regulator
VTTNKPIPLGTPLTARQVEVLDAAARGLDVRQTARSLGLSVTTVRTHRRRVLEAFGAASTTQAVAIAFRKGLLR